MITNTQYQLVKTAMHNAMEGKDFQQLYTYNDSLFDDVVEAFELELNNNHFPTDFDYALERLETVANAIIDSYDMNVFSELADYYNFEEVLDMFENEEIIFHYDVYDMAELAENYLIDTDGIEYHIDNYLDEDALLRDLYLGGDIQDYYYNLVKEDAMDEGMEEEEAERLASDYEITDDDQQNYLEMVIECAGKDFLSRYFDYEAFGRDMEIDGEFYTTDSGIIEVTR